MPRVSVLHAIDNPVAHANTPQELGLCVIVNPPHLIFLWSLESPLSPSHESLHQRSLFLRLQASYKPQICLRHPLRPTPAGSLFDRSFEPRRTVFRYTLAKVSLADWRGTELFKEVHCPSHRPRVGRYDPCFIKTV